MLIQRVSQNYMPIDAPEIDHDVVVVPLHKIEAVGLAFGQGRRLQMRNNNGNYQRDSRCSFFILPLFLPLQLLFRQFGPGLHHNGKIPCCISRDRLSWI